MGNKLQSNGNVASSAAGEHKASDHEIQEIRAKILQYLLASAVAVRVENHVQKQVDSLLQRVMNGIA